MKYVILASIGSLYGFCAGNPAFPLNDQVDRFHHNGTFDHLRKSNNSKQHSDFERIVGGFECNLKYAVSLQGNCGDNVWYPFCSGTLVACDKVLTAGHCGYTIQLLLKYNQDPELQLPCGQMKLRVVYNSVMLYPLSPDADTQEITTSDQLCFPMGYSYQLWTSDLAFIHLRHPFKNCKQKMLPCLAECPREDLSPGKKVTAYGWGATESAFTSNHLKCVNENIITNDECQLSYLDTIVEFGPWTACAQGDEGGICPGDSGGGLILKDSKNKCPQLVGVNSFARTTSCGQYPDGFANLCDPELREWFQCNLENDREEIPTCPPEGLAKTKDLRASLTSDESSGSSSAESNEGDSDCKKCTRCKCLDPAYMS